MINFVDKLYISKLKTDFHFLNQETLVMHFNTTYNNLKAAVSFMSSKQTMINLPMHVSNYYWHIRYIQFLCKEGIIKESTKCILQSRTLTIKMVQLWLWMQ